MIALFVPAICLSQWTCFFAVFRKEGLSIHPFHLWNADPPSRFIPPRDTSASIRPPKTTADDMLFFLSELHLASSIPASLLPPHLPRDQPTPHDRLNVGEFPFQWSLCASLRQQPPWRRAALFWIAITRSFPLVLRPITSTIPLRAVEDPQKRSPDGRILGSRLERINPERGPASGSARVQRPRARALIPFLCAAAPILIAPCPLSRVIRLQSQTRRHVRMKRTRQ